MYLSEISKGKENNLNFIRFVAALSVLVSHSFPLAMGAGTTEPLFIYTGMTLGEISVDIFFIISGFLVTGSLILRKSSVEFIVSRFLRIYPGLMFVILFSVFCLGCFFTKIPLQSYFTDNVTVSYIVKNALMVTGAAYYLPGVFEKNPFPSSVNGSLWTLVWELRMYAILIFLWLILTPLKNNREKYFKILIILLAGCGFLFFQIISSNEWLLKLSRFVYYFFIGGAFYVLREQVKLYKSVAIVFIILIFVATFFDRYVFKIFFMLMMPYVLLYVSYVPHGFIRKFNNLGDYSYGIYIYAFPVQQSIVAIIPGLSVFNLTFLAVCVTLLVSWFSCEFIEQPALRKKNSLSSLIKKSFPILKLTE
ncbi:MAG: acyltransferase [Chlorobiaceae bacterium]